MVGAYMGLVAIEGDQVRRRFILGMVMATSAALVLAPLNAQAETVAPVFIPGAPGIGDSYFPLDGNGGYDAIHYDLDITYDPPSDTVTGVATMLAKTTQDLSRFDLDLVGLTVSSVTVNGKKATWTRTGQELVITPATRLPKGSPLVSVVKYSGVPALYEEQALGTGGFFHTDDGAFIAGQPHAAASWFPVNDHPADKASYDFRITAPKGLEVTANGVLVDRRTKGGLTTSTWVAKEPMASYLTTIAIGKYTVSSYRADGIKFTDAIDSDLFKADVAPAMGTGFAISGTADLSWKRLTRTVSATAGSNLTFKVNRDTEEGYDFVLVEARTAGQNDWTTLPDANGHTSTQTFGACDYLLQVHPFAAHYITAGATGCSPTGSSGAWNAATGQSTGYETWSVDLSAYAGKQVELSITYASDDVFQAPSGVFVDDITGPAGQGTTGFEADGDVRDGWTVPGPPADSPGNRNDWQTGTSDLVVTQGEVAQASLKRQPEIIRFLASNFGPYPFSAAGGIVVDQDDLGFALETQTRPIYANVFFSDQISGDSVVVHEVTHQWFGDNLAVRRWQNIWLNEGFATYGEWLWSEHEGRATAQQLFDAYSSIPADSGFWGLTIGDPGPDNLFAGPVYDRGALTLHALRTTVGDKAFFTILKRWAKEHAGGNVTTPQFTALAESVSGKDLDAFFQTWLYTPEKPASLGAAASSAAAAAAGATARTTTRPPKPLLSSLRK
jgi:hypothetical protein